DLALRPSTSTVHAPHCVVSQPMWVPVRRRCSRRKCASSRRGSTSACRRLPLTVTVILAIGISGRALAYLPLVIRAMRRESLSGRPLSSEEVFQGELNQAGIERGGDR